MNPFLNFIDVVYAKKPRILMNTNYHLNRRALLNSIR